MADFACMLDTSGFKTDRKPVVHSRYLQLGPSVDLSDISKGFEVDDIFT